LYAFPNGDCATRVTSPRISHRHAPGADRGPHLASVLPRAKNIHTNSAVIWGKPGSVKIADMQKVQFDSISHLEGLDFIRALVELEEQRFEQSQFLKGSTFEDINADFGIFPTMAAYPIYFMGDVKRPKDKIIFMGINPGFNEERNKKEQAYLESCGIFEGYRRLFGDFRYGRNKGLLPYYANIAGFLRRYLGITEAIDWDWYQENFIALELIPYHSVNANGLRINNIKKYRDVYFEIILKLLKHLDPARPVFINGFPTYKNLLEHPELFVDVLTFTKHGNFWTGEIGGYDFIGLPFLTRPKGGKDSLVEAIQRVLPRFEWGKL
jgi:hypothetical protein